MKNHQARLDLNASAVGVLQWNPPAAIAGREMSNHSYYPDGFSLAQVGNPSSSNPSSTPSCKPKKITTQQALEYARWMDQTFDFRQDAFGFTSAVAWVEAILEQLPGIYRQAAEKLDNQANHLMVEAAHVDGFLRGRDELVDHVDGSQDIPW